MMLHQFAAMVLGAILGAILGAFGMWRYFRRFTSPPGFETGGIVPPSDRLMCNLARLAKMDYADAERRVIMNLGGAEFRAYAEQDRLNISHRVAEMEFDCDACDASHPRSRCKDPARCYLEWKAMQRRRRINTYVVIIVACVFAIAVVSAAVWELS
jgi:hypothetical protein